MKIAKLAQLFLIMSIPANIIFAEVVKQAAEDLSKHDCEKTHSKAYCTEKPNLTHSVIDNAKK